MGQTEADCWSLCDYSGGAGGPAVTVLQQRLRLLSALTAAVITGAGSSPLSYDTRLPHHGLTTTRRRRRRRFVYVEL